jgi:hypothetical protein
MTGWHFLQKDRTLRYDDGRKVEVGNVLEVSGVPQVAEWGLHASTNIYSALRYAPGLWLCNVSVWGDVKQFMDLFCGRNRRVNAMHYLREPYLQILRETFGFASHDIDDLPDTAVITAMLTVLWRLDRDERNALLDKALESAMITAVS